MTNNQSNDLEDSEEDIFHQMMMDDGEIDNLLLENRTSDEDDNRDKNMCKLDPSISDIKTNNLTSRNESEI